MFRKSCLVGAFVLVTSVFTNAQTAKTYIGPQLGWQKASNADNGEFMPGAVMRIKFSPSFAFEGSINYRAEDYDNGNVTVKTWPVMLSGLIYPINTVYGLAGVGWYNTSVNYSDELHGMGLSDKTSQKFGWHFGVGAEFPLSENSNPASTILKTDFRYVFLNYNFEKVPGSPDIRSDYFVLTVGLLFGL